MKDSFYFSFFTSSHLFRIRVYLRTNLKDEVFDFQNFYIVRPFRICFSERFSAVRDLGRKRRKRRRLERDLYAERAGNGA